MRFSQLTEDAPSKDIRNMVTTIALSLISTGREQINVNSLISEIKKRSGIDVPYDVMMEVLMSLPFVQDANSDVVTFGSVNGDVPEEESSEEIVRDMATKTAAKDLEK